MTDEDDNDVSTDGDAFSRVDAWWETTAVMLNLLEPAGLHSAPAAASDEPLDLDTPPPVPLTEKEEHDYNTLEEMQMQEDAAAYDRFMLEQEASRAQAEDDKCLADAVRRGKKPRHRLHLGITVTSGATSSRSHIDTSLPSATDPVTVTFTLQPREVELVDDEQNNTVLDTGAFSQQNEDPIEDGDHTHLMQRLRPSTSQPDGVLAARIRHLLAVVHPQMRTAILHALRHRLTHRLRQLLYQVNEILAILQQGTLGDAACAAVDESTIRNESGCQLHRQSGGPEHHPGE